MSDVIDNGRRVSLIVPGLFEGMAGVSADEVAFIPRSRRQISAGATRALLDESPVMLTLKRRPEPGSPFAICSFRAAS